MPDPRRERQKKLLVYDPAMHDYSREAPSGANCGLSILYCAALPKPSSGCRADPRHFGLNRCLRLFYATFIVYSLTFSDSSTTIESASLILILSY